MAVRIGSLFVSLTADTGPFAQSMARMRQATSNATSGINRNITLTQRSVQNLNRTMGQRISVGRLMSASRAFEETADRANLLRSVVLSTTGIFGGFAAALSTNIVLRYADSYTKLSNQIRVVSTDSADLESRLAAISQVAQASRSGLRETGILYNRLQKAAPDQNADQLLQYVETIQKALQVGGATAQEASSAAIQFSQAIASNRLSGDEIRAILETPLGLQLAKGLGVTIGKLREMGQAGQLTASTVLGALSNIREGVDKQFASTVITVDQSLVVLDNAFTQAIGKMNQAYGVTRLLTGGILAIAGAAPQVISSLTLIGGALAAVLAGKFIGGRAGTAETPGRGIAGFFGLISSNAKAARLEVTATTEAVKKAQVDLQKAILNRNQIAGKVSTNALSFAQPSELSAIKRAQRDVVQLDKQLTESVRQRRAIAANMNTTTDLQAQVALQKQLVNEQQRSMRLTVEKANAEANVRNLTSGAALSGRNAGLGQLREASAATQKYGETLRVVQGENFNAIRSATKLSQAWELVKVGAGGLLGVLGGPWGVAIAAAIGALEFFGSRAAATAQKVATAQQIIAERLAKMGEDPNAGSGAGSARESQTSLRVKALGESLNLVRDESVRLGNDITQALGAIPSKFDPVAVAARNATGAFVDGKIGAGEYRDRMTDLQSQFESTNPALAKLITTVMESAVQLRGAAISAKDMTSEIATLQAQVASGVTVKVSFREAEDASQKTLDNIDITKQKIQELKGDVRESEFRAKGLTAEAKAAQAAQAARAQGKFLNEADLIPYFRMIEANDKIASSAKKSNKEIERTAEIIDRIKREGEGAFLPDIDRQVIEKTKNIKNAATEVRAYIDAIQSGDLSKAPKDLLAVREALIQSGAAESYRGIVEQYGRGAQTAQQFALKQAELNYLVNTGMISAEQGAFAWADYVGQFGNFKWIDQVADAVGNLASTSITNFKDVGEAGKTFLQELLKVAVQILLIEPIIKNVRGLLSGGFSSGGVGAGNIFSGIGNFLFGTTSSAGVSAFNSGAAIYHSGTSRVGMSPQRSRNVSPMLFRGAPRFHQGLGLGTGEFPAILQQGEKVIPRGMGMGGSPLSFSTIIDARGSNLSEEDFKRLLDARDRNLMKQVIPAVRQAHSRRAL